MKKHLLIVALSLATIIVAGSVACAQDEEFYLDPLGEVIVDMQVAGGRLSRLLTDKTTQRKQQDAVEKLDALILLLERRRRQQGGGMGGNPDEPLDNERIVAGPGGSGPLHDARRNGAQWGQLPPHKRQEILQSMTEGFPAHYRQILEGYYRRLADETPADAVADDSSVGTAEVTPPDNPPSASDNPPAQSEKQ